MYRQELAGATVLLGVDGTAAGARRRATFFGANIEVSLMIISVGPGAAIARVLPEMRALLPEALLTLERCRRWFALIDQLTSDTGLVTSEMVPAYRATGPGIAHGGLKLAGSLPAQAPS